MRGIHRALDALATADPAHSAFVARLRLLDPDRFHDLDEFTRESAGYRDIARVAERLRAAGRFHEARIARLSGPLARVSEAAAPWARLSAEAVLEQPEPDVSPLQRGFATDAQLWTKIATRKPIIASLGGKYHRDMLDEDARKLYEEVKGKRFDEHRPDVVVGSSRGGAVAMNLRNDSARLVLLCPAWKKWGSAKTVG